MPASFPRSDPSGPTPGRYLPHDLADRLLFLATRAIRAEHRRGQFYDSSHTVGPIARCGACHALALDALEVRARKARLNGWSRSRSLTELGAWIEDSGDLVIRNDRYHVGVRDNAVRSGSELALPREGRLAKPEQAPFGAIYARALGHAWARGELPVDPLHAQLYLGYLIRAVQDPTAPIDRGHLLPYAVAERRLANRGEDLPPGVSGQVLFAAIERACDRDPRAAALLQRHVFAFTEGASRHTAPLLGPAEEADPDGAAVTAIDLAHDRQHLAPPDDEATKITNQLVSTLLRRGSDDLATAIALARRFIDEEYGPGTADGVDPSIVEDLAAHALDIAFPGPVTGTAH